MKPKIVKTKPAKTPASSDCVATESGPYPTIAESLRLRNQFCFSLYTASRFVVQAYQPILEKLDLTYLQYITMLVLWEHKAVTVSALGDQLLLDSGTLSPLLKKLEQKELVTRQRQPSDERSVIIKPTSKGWELQTKGTSVPSQLACLVGPLVESLPALKKGLQELTKQLRQHNLCSQT